MSARVYVRKFDHDEAQQRFAAGESARALATAYGVTTAAIYYAVKPGYRQAMLTYHRTWQSNRTCSECGGVASRRGGGGPSRCISCAARHAATSVRDETLRCVVCREWKPDQEFPHNKSEKQRRGRHSACRSCATAIKRSWRERNKVPCSHGCGTLVDAKNRRNPEKPPECLPCALKRIHRERREAAA